MPPIEPDQAAHSFSIGTKRKRERDNEDLKTLGFYVKRSKRSPRRVFNNRATILSWLIDSGMFQENAEIFSLDAISKLQMKHRGKIKREGILCMCCNKVFTVAKIHLHWGGNGDKPYESIFVAKTKVSLLSYMNDACSKAREECESVKLDVVETKGKTKDSYDDACMICADGGDLMCCEKCNSTYHQVCMDLEDVPEGTWYCPYCVCKFCAEPAHKNDYLLKCPQCEKRYHWECHQIKEQKSINLNSIPIAPFCERSCKKVWDKLRKGMVGKKNEVEGGYSWTLLHHQMEDDDCCEDKYLRTICHSKLAVAATLMEQCFETIKDRYTGIKIIPSVVYNCGSKFGRLNFQGFYTAVLEKDDEIISTASLRIHGTKLAEMPFISTSEAYRCKGMCRKLMIGIESALRYLNVENLIIPSVPEKIRSWMEGYGFRRLDVSMKKEIMSRNTLMFHDSLRLQKILLSSPSNQLAQPSW